MSAVAESVLAPKLGYEDVVPYELPISLDRLTGPSHGEVRGIPYNISTAPNPVYDLAKPGRVRSLYSATVRDGIASQQEAILNKKCLVGVWRELNIPQRCRELWESRFPELLRQ